MHGVWPKTASLWLYKSVLAEKLNLIVCGLKADVEDPAVVEKS
jgi:hypothetical protein